jgi:hypothetical protein
MFPKIKKKRIREINQEIDNPSIFYKQFKKSLGNSTTTTYSSRIPGINYNNHRKSGGHDMTDLVYYSSKYGRDGVNAWFAHTFEDMFSDFITRNYGSFARNILEDSILEFSRKKYHQRSRF